MRIVFRGLRGNDCLFGFGGNDQIEGGNRRYLIGGGRVTISPPSSGAEPRYHRGRRDFALGDAFGTSEGAAGETIFGRSILLPKGVGA
jgi:hypothetical protein